MFSWLSVFHFFFICKIFVSCLHIVDNLGKLIVTSFSCFLVSKMHFKIILVNTIIIWVSKTLQRRITTSWSLVVLWHQIDLKQTVKFKLVSLICMTNDFKISSYTSICASNCRPCQRDYDFIFLLLSFILYLANYRYCSSIQEIHNKMLALLPIWICIGLCLLPNHIQHVC